MVRKTKRDTLLNSRLTIFVGDSTHLGYYSSNSGWCNTPVVHTNIGYKKNTRDNQQYNSMHTQPSWGRGRGEGILTIKSGESHTAYYTAGTIVNRTYRTHKNLYTSLFLQTNSWSYFSMVPRINGMTRLVPALRWLNARAAVRHGRRQRSPARRILLGGHAAFSH